MLNGTYYLNNSGSVCISYKGKKRNVLADTILED